MNGISPDFAFSVASNIVDGENPPYGCDDFRAIMPAFSKENIPDEILQHYIDMANAVVKEARWMSLWKEGMRLYIAHFATLYLDAPQAGATRQQIQNSGKMQGNKTSKSVGQVSVAYDAGVQATNDLSGWAAWKLTAYGVQFASLAKIIGMGGMYVR